MTRFSQQAVWGLLAFLSLITLGGAPAWAIVGGTDVPSVPGSNPPAQTLYPWNAEVQLGTDQSNANNLCGATLIGARFVITAAHCVDGLTTTNLYVTVGGYDLAEGSQTGQTVAVSSIIENPNFNSSTLTSDIAVLVLQQNVTNVQTPIYVTQSVLPSGQTATVIGWGATFDSGPNVDILEQTQVQTVDSATCAAQLVGAGFPVTATSICAGVSAGGHDACQGDTGGPLFIVGPSGKPVQIGITSWGLGCGLPNTPGVYTNLAAMMGFILDTLGGQSFVHLADYAANGDQLKVAQILDRVGPAAGAGSTILDDYGRLFMNGVGGTSQSLESLLPGTAFEMNAMVKDFDEMRGDDIMARARALREGRTGGLFDTSNLHMPDTSGPGSVNPSTGLMSESYGGAQTAPAGNGNPTSVTAGQGQMYNPALYSDQDLSTATNPPPHKVDYTYTYNGPIYAQPYDQPSKTDTQSTQATGGGFFGWLDDLLIGPGGAERESFNYDDNEQLIEANNHYLGQPLGAYAAQQAIAPTPVSTLVVNEPAIAVTTQTSSPSAATVPGGAVAAYQAQNYGVTPTATNQTTLIVDRRWGFFASGSVRLGDEQLMRDTDSTQSVIGGFTVGGDYRLNPQSYLGLAFSYAHGSFSTDDISSVDSNGYALSLYGTTTYAQHAYLDGYLSTAYHTFDSDRTLLIGNGQTRDATASPTAIQIGSNLETGYDFSEDTTHYGPFAGFHISAANFDGYAENGGQTFDLSVLDRYDLSAIGSLGGQLAHRFALGDGSLLAPEIRAAFNHEFGFGYPQVQASFVNIPNSNFTIDGEQHGTNWLSINPSISAMLANNWLLQADYQHDFFRSDISQQIFNFGARYRW